MQQLDLLAALDDPAPPSAIWTPAPPGRNARTEAEAAQTLLDHLLVAVPLHMAEMAGWSQERRRRVGLPAGWSALVGMADSMMFLPQTAGRSEAAYGLYARGLAVLAYEAGGSGLFGAHWCAAPHPGCPVGSPTLVVPLAALAARCRAAMARPEWQGPLVDLEALLADDGRPVHRRATRTVPRTRRPVRAPRVVDVPTGGVL
ncbi:hypothetical protein BBK14_11405 [Parafrankia soli]|uniref:Uncharacterized protein n=1 Tax=Parafrankia soli TaxID=2599596 RepID=A0A1S1R7R6_9ACTN|nr:hypothetical protein [Parafrankia soli]OHV42220.1 hypothetical protein BBK14_11405 [Parafrankia soli]